MLLEVSAIVGCTVLVLVLVTSQNLGLVERPCDRFVRTHERRIQVAGSISEVRDAERQLLVSTSPASAPNLVSLPRGRRVPSDTHGFLVTGRIAPHVVRAYPR